MKNTKEIFEAITTNQNKLAEALNENAHQLMEIVEPDNSIEKFAKDTAATYMAQGREYLESMTKAEHPEDAMKTMQSAFTKFMDMQAEVYNKTTEFYQDWFKRHTWEKGQEQFKKATEIYQNSFKAIAETATANTKAMQELMG
ncbi:MAG: hypothetical protein AAGG75_01955 [Bacteroidota bacterium]